MELTIDQALQQGVEAHKEGKLQDAERLYRAILQAQPNHPDANHNFGVLAVSVGKPLEAIPLFKLALDANPQIEQFWLSYIDVLIKVGRFDEAKRVTLEGGKSGVSSDKLDALNQLLQESVPNDKTKTGKGQTVSIPSNATSSPPHTSEQTRVNAAVSVVLPWSTCPIVPTLTWGFERSNASFAMATHSPEFLSVRRPVCASLSTSRYFALGAIPNWSS